MTMLHSENACAYPRVKNAVNASVVCVQRDAYDVIA